MQILPEKFDIASTPVWLVPDVVEIHFPVWINLCITDLEICIAAQKQRSS